MDDDQDWRLRVDVADAPALHAHLRGARHLEGELEQIVGDDVVLSLDDHTLFAYATTRAAIEGAREAIERKLADDGLSASVALSHWIDDIEYWHQVDPPPDAEERERERERAADAQVETQRDARVVTRTVAVTSGRLARKWVEDAVIADAQERGVEVSIVEHPHLLQTQIAFTLSGPKSEVDDVVADLRARNDQLTLLEGANLAPL